jgi:hypothetical protein
MEIQSKYYVLMEAEIAGANGLKVGPILRKIRRV